ncbi:MAG: hypothetical protein ACOH10_08045 [Rhodoglobus sp.]
MSEYAVQHVQVVPAQDPTPLTREALSTAVADLRERLDDAVGTRQREMAALEKTFMILIDGHISTLTTLHVGDIRVINEQFAAIAQRFTERDVRTEQAAVAGASALAAALQAAKELVGAQGEASAAAAVKSETAVTKQIDQITELIRTGNAASDARVTELKERIDRGEGAVAGTHDTRLDVRANISMWIAVAAIVGGALTAILVRLFGG